MPAIKIFKNLANNFKFHVKLIYNKSVRSVELLSRDVPVLVPVPAGSGAFFRFWPESKKNSVQGYPYCIVPKYRKFLNI